MKWSKKAIMAKTETVYGQDATPTGADNAILASNISIEPIVADYIKRENPRPYAGSYEELAVGAHMLIEFDVEVASSGTLGTAPAYGPLMLACAWDEVVTATTKVEYTPTDLTESSGDSVSLYMRWDGRKHVFLGARGNVIKRVNPKGYAYYHFRLLGLYGGVVDQADETMTYTAFKKPLPVSNANTTITLHGFSAKMSALELNLNNEVFHRDLVGEEAVVISDRAPGGSITIIAPTLTTKDFIAIAKEGTAGALSIVHGTVAGSIVETALPSVQLLRPKYTELNKEVAMTFDLNILPVSGNDEWVETIR